MPSKDYNMAQRHLYTLTYNFSKTPLEKFSGYFVLSLRTMDYNANGMLKLSLEESFDHMPQLYH